MRVYIPATLEDLAACTAGAWRPQLGYAVTELLLEIAASEDPDEVAEMARDVAATASVIDGGSPRRVVIVADLARAEAEEAPDLHPAAVRLTEAVMPDAVACAFLDEPEATDDVTAAVAGDAEALDRLEERDLLWFDASELAHLDV
ncbi:DUF6912 family protein [Demequina pelophila]|uniref:DUF6912 family protein n=1 Tax=Demequina pelophila TaxID=1638984 RepID=UPI00078324B9|nr:hypothetical protein [Demequina pelophila]